MYRCQLLAGVWFAWCAAGLVPMRGRIGGNVRQFANSEHLNHKQAMADFKGAAGEPSNVMDKLKRLAA